METYDYIVVGAGSAGCVLASRLTEDGRHRVLLVEAGTRAVNPLYDFPMLAGSLYRSRYNNWFYSTEPQPFLNDRRVPMPRGRMVGGSFIFNGMVYIRGQAADYDQWAQSGCQGWSYADVLPYFRRSENYEGGASFYHGTDGPLVVNEARSANPLFDAFVEAGVQAGFPHNQDFNGPTQQGFGRFNFTIRNGKRWNTASAFLDPALSRNNLKVLSSALASRLLLEDRVVRGVEFFRGDQKTEARATREVILCGGTVNTPQLLMLSGVGASEHLASTGIEVKHHLPGVGRNLQDHLDVTLAYECKEPVSLINSLRLDRFAVQFLKSAAVGKGPVSESAIEAGCFLSVADNTQNPDVQAHFMPIYSNGAHLWLTRMGKKKNLETGQTFAARFGPTRPQSRGYITLKSSDVRDAPAIQPMYFSAENDLRLTRDSFKIMRTVFCQPAFDQYRGIEISPGASVRRDDEIEAWCREVATTVHHPIGTAKMGIDDMAVVDAELCVRGLKGLRIADASVMPTLVSGNTNAPTIMIAEKAADMILGRKPLEPAVI